MNREVLTIVGIVLATIVTLVSVVVFGIDHRINPMRHALCYLHNELHDLKVDLGKESQERSDICPWLAPDIPDSM